MHQAICSCLSRHAHACWHSLEHLLEEVEKVAKRKTSKFIYIYIYIYMYIYKFRCFSFCNLFNLLQQMFQ